MQWLLRGSVVVFVVSSMLAMGLGVQVSEVIAPLRQPSLVLRALAANFILAPAVALSMAWLLPLDPRYEAGLLLLAFAAGSPLLAKLAQIGGADVGRAAALMILLMAASVLFLPLALPLFVEGMQANPWRIAAPLVGLMLVPLALGVALRRVAPGTAVRLVPAMSGLSNVGFAVFVLLLFGLNLSALLGVLGSGAIAAAIAFIVLLFACAWALGVPDAAGRGLFGYATAMRNIGAALVTARASGAEPETVVMLIVTGLVGLLLLISVAAAARGRSGAG